MELGDRTARAWRAVGLTAVLTLLVAPAGATTDVIKRSFENMPQGVVDAALSPVTAGTAIYNNMTTIEDTVPVRVAYAVPGYFWNVMCNLGGGVIRSITGLMELPAGLVLLFSDAEMEPLFDPAEDNEALLLLDQFEDVYRVKVGVDYTTGG
jgi:ABC-type arginine/histidine transport system permease subunit